MSAEDVVLRLAAAVGAIALIWTALYGLWRAVRAGYRKWIRPMTEMARVLMQNPSAAKMLADVHRQVTVNAGSGTIRDMIEATSQGVAELRAEVRHSRREFHLLHDDAKWGWFSTDTSGACVFVNRTLLRWTERTLDEVLGYGWIGYIHPQDRDRVRHEWEAAVGEEREFAMTHRLISLTGRVLAVHTSARPLGDGRAYIGKVALEADIAERDRDTKASER